MASTAFHFAPQPALDRAVADRQRCEEAVVEARRDLEDERGRLCDLERITVELQHQWQREVDRLGEPAGVALPAGTMAARSRHIELLAARRAQHRGAVARQTEQIVLAEQKVRIRLEALSQAIGAVQALEAVKTRMLDQHRREQGRRQARKAQDATLMRHHRGSGSP